MTRILVCGGRDFIMTPDYELRFMEWLKLANATALIHGDARGADRSAALVAVKLSIPVFACPADWERHGKAAGAIRNQFMLDHHSPDVGLAFPGGRGTADMIRRLHRANIPVVLTSR